MRYGAKAIAWQKILVGKPIIVPVSGNIYTVNCRVSTVMFSIYCDMCSCYGLVGEWQWQLGVFYHIFYYLKKNELGPLTFDRVVLSTTDLIYDKYAFEYALQYH